ncbi:MAG: sugar transferase [Acidimicrobiales bacterium]
MGIARVGAHAGHRGDSAARTCSDAGGDRADQDARVVDGAISAEAAATVVAADPFALAGAGTYGSTVTVEPFATPSAHDAVRDHATVPDPPESLAAHVLRPRGSLRLRWLLVGLDAAALLASWMPLSLADTSGLDRSQLGGSLALGTAMVLTTLACLGVASARRLYRSRVASIKEHERALLVSVAVASAVVGGVALRLLGVRPPLGALAGDAAIAFLLLVGERSAYRSWLKVQRQRGRFVRPTVVLGANEEGRYWCRQFAEHPELGVSVKGVVDDVPLEPASTAAPWLGPCADAAKLARSVGATGVLVMTTAFTAAELRRITRQLMQADLHVQLSMGLLGLAHGRLTITQVSHENLLYLERRSLSPRSLALKRALDLVVASVSLVLSAPLMAVLAYLVHREDGGPVLFAQERIGHNGKPFRLYKLRTMIPDAEARKAELAEDNMRQGPLFKAADDPRVTRVGRLLRATSLDEMPQLFNVVLGEMSLVGPRPALPEEVEQFDEELLLRHDVMPGITGLWQVEGRDDASFESYHRLDLHYVENWSVLLDVSILVSTAAALAGRALRALLAAHSGEQIPV